MIGYNCFIIEITNVKFAWSWLLLKSAHINYKIQFLCYKDWTDWNNCDETLENTCLKIQTNKLSKICDDTADPWFHQRF